MASRARVLAVGHTDVGMKRAHNEDNFDVIDEYNLYVVADGMGGHASGEVASQMAIDTLREFFRATHADPEATWPYKMDKSRGYEENRLMTSIKLANLRIYEAAQRDPKLRGMGTTICGILVVDEGVLIAHVGDSRVYRLRHRRIERLTRDHSVVSDMEFALGHPILQRSSHPMGTVVTRALGGGGDARPDVRFLDVAPKDRFLLCSDGLTDSIVESELRPLLARGTPDEASDYLMEQAIRNGARDNVTVIVVDVLRL